MPKIIKKNAQHTHLEDVQNQNEIYNLVKRLSDNHLTPHILAHLM